MASTIGVLYSANVPTSCIEANGDVVKIGFTNRTVNTRMSELVGTLHSVISAINPERLPKCLFGILSENAAAVESYAFHVLREYRVGDSEYVYRDAQQIRELFASIIDQFGGRFISLAEYDVIFNPDNLNENNAVKHPYEYYIKDLEILRSQRVVKLLPSQMQIMQQINIVGKTLLDLPPRYGKTIIAINFITRIRSYINYRVAIFVPRIMLCEQWAADLQRYGKVPRNAIRVIHHDTIDNYAEYARIFVCVYDSFDKLSLLDIGTVIVDESHHILGHTNSRSGDIMDIARKSPCQIYMSGTINKPDEFQPNEYCKISISEMLQEKRSVKFPDYEIGILKIPNITETFTHVCDYIKNTQCKKILVFSNSCLTSSEFSNYANKIGIPTGYYDGSTSKHERDNINTKFTDTNFSTALRVLSTVRTVSEGVTFAAADAVIMIDPRNSDSDIIQTMMRPFTPMPDKTTVNIILTSYGPDYESHESMLKKILHADDLLFRNFVTNSNRVYVIDSTNTQILNRSKESNSDTVIEILNRFGEFKREILIEKTKTISYNRAQKIIYDHYPEFNDRHRENYHVLREKYPELPEFPDDEYRHRGWFDWCHYLSIDKEKFPDIKEATVIASENTELLQSLSDPRKKYGVLYKLYPKLPHPSIKDDVYHDSNEIFKFVDTHRE
ncbi:MAG TPA: helicase-related protein [Candidatus Paceibacterota bacterium]